MNGLALFESQIYSRCSFAFQTYYSIKYYVVSILCMTAANKILYVGLNDRETKDIWHMRMKAPLTNDFFLVAWQHSELIQK